MSSHLQPVGLAPSGLEASAALSTAVKVEPYQRSNDICLMSKALLTVNYINRRSWASDGAIIHIGSLGAHKGVVSTRQSGEVLASPQQASMQIKLENAGVDRRVHASVIFTRCTAMELVPELQRKWQDTITHCSDGSTPFAIYIIFCPSELIGSPLCYCPLLHI